MKTGPGSPAAATSPLCYWLHTQYRVQLKVVVLVYKALQGQSSLYNRNLLQVHTTTRNLRSQNNATVLVVPKTRKVMFIDGRFMIAAPDFGTPCQKQSQTLAH